MQKKSKLLKNQYSITFTPSNRLEKLQGSDFYSIKINFQWRIVFQWINKNTHAVEIMDYHKKTVS
ncbi:MAG: hypothetical protein EA362_01465 [Saprospirales bacterium]|nr:MAG: hypothetical protein EA362_01465 [Saprospirales bacterium]TVQ93640.1 MAG: hypothetical protein EA393_02005 [Bacteroidota bacterium]